MPEPTPPATPQDEAFQTTVLDGVKTLKTNQQKLLSEIDRLDKESKSALENFTAAAKRLDDVDTVLKSMKRLQGALHREGEHAFGSGKKRISADPELRARLNAAVRAAAGKPGEHLRTAKAILQKASLTEDTEPGSTYITEALAHEIYDTLAQYGAWTTLGQRRLGTKITRFPVKTARPTAGFVRFNAGGTVASDTSKAGTQKFVEVELIGVELSISKELLEDSEFDVTTDILDDFAQAFAERMDYMAFLADGTADYANGGFNGILPTAAATAAATGNTTIGKCTVDDFITALAAVDAAVLTRQPKWWMNPQNLVRCLGIKDNNGRPIFLTALEAPSYGALGSILGRPVVPVNVLPAKDKADAPIAAFGDPEAAIVGIRSDFGFDQSDIPGWTAFDRSFRGCARAGFGIRADTALTVLTTAADED